MSLGWGCGYRTLQTLCSWVRKQQLDTSGSPPEVPNIKDIQEALVAMEDKPSSFNGSRTWIGSVEVSLCVDYFFEVPCRVVHITSGSALPEHLTQIAKHFEETGAPIMMGGDSDASSKGIIGVCVDQPSLLVVDPHYYGSSVSKTVLQEAGWVRWIPLDQFCQHSFYNMCMPVYKHVKR